MHHYLPTNHLSIESSLINYLHDFINYPIELILINYPIESILIGYLYDSINYPIESSPINDD